MPADPQQRQAELVSALRNPALYGDYCDAVQAVETHISFVLLTGRFAYKIKKAVDVGFLDFTTLARRRHFCDRELELNRRTAPSLYLDVVAITGTPSRPTIGGPGVVIEWAVRMRQFPQRALLSEMLAHDELTASDIDRLARVVAGFHARAAAVDPGSSFGTTEDMLRLSLDNVEVLRPMLDSDAGRADCDLIARWTRDEYVRRRDAFIARRAGGFVRECHGDLHLGNIVVIDGEITLFDCIEFDDRMRFIDVASEIAFVIMDLASRGRPDLASRFANAYLQITGDYAGVAVLRFHLVYRALVRAKIAGMRAAQAASSEVAGAASADCDRHLRLAKAFIDATGAAVVITHGLSGSGKTALSQALLELAGIIRVRTDVERKRMHAIDPGSRPGAEIEAGVYAPEATRKTYLRVLGMARHVVSGGYAVVVDGSFLRQWQREMFRTLAAELSIPFLIVAFTARDATLRSRIRARAESGDDASDADTGVLDYQLRSQEPFTADELPCVMTHDAEQPLALASQRDTWRQLLARLAITPAAVDTGATPVS